MKIQLRNIEIEHEGATFQFKDPNPKELMDLASTEAVEERIKKVFALLTEVSGVENGNGPIDKDAFLAMYDDLPGRIVLQIGNKAAMAMLGVEKPEGNEPSATNASPD